VYSTDLKLAIDFGVFAAIVQNPLVETSAALLLFG
jgi:hypothetical protein